MTTIDRAQHDKLANAIRGLAMDGVEKAKSGHPGLPMGAADVATVLFTRVMKYDAADPRWPDRDRFVLSAGHGSMLLYALLYLTGVPGLELDDLKKFRQLESKTPGHPENFMTLGVETTTGPLGQGLATAVGMAMAERMLAAEFGRKVVDHHTYVLASDGDLMEGISQEAIALAGHQKLNKLIVLWTTTASRSTARSRSPTMSTRSRASRPAAGAPSASTGMIPTRSRPRSSAPGSRQADDDRLQDDHRLRRAEEAGHLQGAWRGARRRGAGGRQEEPRHHRWRLSRSQPTC